MTRKSCLALVAFVLALTVACTKSSSSPTSPSALGGASTGNAAALSKAVAPRAAAAAGGVTLKVSAPTPQSPINGIKPMGPDITLVIGNATTTFVSGIPLVYRFQLFDAAGVMLDDSGQLPPGAGTTSHLLTVLLEADKAYTWQARAEYQTFVGPWSAQATFIAPQTGGYIRGNELYDPLINGKSIGVVHGPVTFIPGQGAMLGDQTAYISYELQQTLYEGEFSIIASTLKPCTAAGKTKLFAMAQGYDDIITNDRRMSVEKRGILGGCGVIAWRLLTHDDRIETGGSERVAYQFDRTKDYFWQATWRANVFNVLINEGGVAGNTIYNFGKTWAGRQYDPNPHVIYIGAPVGRSGTDGASVDGVTIRQVWVSGNPRPAFANK